MIRKRNKPVQEETYVVVNKDGQAFIGLKGGYPDYSDDWSKQNHYLLTIQKCYFAIKEQN
jgi:hypothetical protein